MDLVSLTRWATIAVYGALFLVAVVVAWRDHDRARSVSAGFMAAGALAWALFYLSLAFGLLEGPNLVVITSRVMHLVTVGVLISYLNALRVSRKLEIQAGVEES